MYLGISGNRKKGLSYNNKSLKKETQNLTFNIFKTGKRKKFTRNYN